VRNLGRRAECAGRVDSRRSCGTKFCPIFRNASGRNRHSASQASHAAGQHGDSADRAADPRNRYAERDAQRNFADRVDFESEWSAFDHNAEYRNRSGSSVRNDAWSRERRIGWIGNDPVIPGDAAVWFIGNQRDGNSVPASSVAEQ
jgi:hypothetical protein